MNNEKDLQVNDNGVNKDILKKIVDEKTLQAVLDNKLTKRALANSLLELAEQEEKEKEVLDNIYGVITTLGSPFLADYFYDLNQNITKKGKKKKNTTKITKNNIQ